MRTHLYEILAAVLFLGALVFFYECIGFLTRRDYVAAALLVVVGIAVIRVGSELARLAMIDRR